MAAWSGFTDEDLRKMRHNSQETSADDKRGSSSKRGMARRPRGSAAPRQITERPSDLAQGRTIRSEERLSSDKNVAREGSRKDLHRGEMAKNEDVSKSDSSSSAQSTAQSSETDRNLKQETVPQKEVVELSSDQALSMELDNVVKFQQQQKVIEEANKQKRALLSKAIEERRKMAKAEAQKLVKIQQELTHLDTLLNVDVGIIRDKIEIASLDYAHAQKRYEKAEKEFIEAKMDLFEKSEAKEKLTEHLYTIINQNEIRKAKKLVELMEQLAMQISPEEMELSMPSIPQLTNFTAASTIHQPGVLNNPQKASSSSPQITEETGSDVHSRPLDGEASRDGVMAEDGNCKVVADGSKKIDSGVVSDGAVRSGHGDDGSVEGRCTASITDGKLMTENVKEQILNVGLNNDSENSGLIPSSASDSCNNTDNSKALLHTSSVKSQPHFSENNNNDYSGKPSEEFFENQTVVTGDVESFKPQTPTQNSSNLTSPPDMNSLSERTITVPAVSPQKAQDTTTAMTSSTDLNESLSPSAKSKDTTKAKGWSLPFV